MISPDQFEKLVIGIDSKIDKLTDNQKETCERLTRVEQKVEDYIDLKVKSTEKKYQYITIALSGITVFSTIWTFLK